MEYTTFDPKTIQQMIEEYKSKAIDDVKYSGLIARVPLENRWRILTESDLQFTKVDDEEIIAYENFYRVRFPDLIKYLLTKVGNSPSFFDLEFISSDTQKIFTPNFYQSERFFIECATHGISQEKLNEFEVYYSVESNSFTDEELQAVYEKLGSAEESHIIKLLNTGQGTSAGPDLIVLNSPDNGKMVYAVTFSTHIINGKTYTHYTYIWQNEYFEQYFLDLLRRKISSSYTFAELQEIGK